MCLPKNLARRSVCAFAVLANFYSKDFPLGTLYFSVVHISMKQTSKSPASAISPQPHNGRGGSRTPGVSGVTDLQSAAIATMHTRPGKRLLMRWSQPQTVYVEVSPKRKF